MYGFSPSIDKDTYVSFALLRFCKKYRVIRLECNSKNKKISKYLFEQIRRRKRNEDAENFSRLLVSN